MNKHRSKNTSFAAALIATVSILSACSPTPSGVLDPEDMARLLADMEIAESVVETAPSEWRGDSMKMVLRQSVYLRHGVTSEEVDSSLAWYGRNIEKFPEVYDRVIDILDNRMAEARNIGTVPATAENIISEDGDSVDVWIGERSWRFAPSGRPADIITFAFNRDRNFELGDAYTMRFKIVGGAARIQAALVGEYTSGMKDYTVLDRRGQGWYHITLPLDSSTTVSRIYGSVGVAPQSCQSVFVDSISLVRLHTKEGRDIKKSPRYRLKR